MKKQVSLYNLSQKLINIFTFLLFSIAILSALSMLIKIFLSSTTQCFIGIIITFLLTTIVYFFHHSLFVLYKKIVYNSKIIIFLFIVLFFIQISIFSTISNNILSDAGSIFNGVFSSDKTAVINYLSQWQNNFPLYVYESIIKNLFHLSSITKQTTFLYTTINIINYDLGFLFLYLMIRKVYNAEVAFSTLLACFLVLGLNNQMYQFYTTALSWPATCLGLYMYIRIKKSTSWKAYSLYSFIFGLSLSWGYLARPSSIIYAIAIIIFEILQLKEKKHYVYKKITIITFFLCGFLLFNIIFQNISKTYTLPLDETKNAVMTQYLAYGITGEGAGTPEVRSAIENAASTDERSALSLSIWKSELTKMGPLGYLRFLLEKHMTETKDGTYGLINPHIEEVDSQNPIIKFLQDIWYSNGKFVDITATFMQIIYLLLLLGTLFSIRTKDRLSFIFKLSLFGWHLFLLIFEGARTGYTIQAFPVMIPLAVLGFSSFKGKDLSFQNKQKI